MGGGGGICGGRGDMWRKRGYVAEEGMVVVVVDVNGGGYTYIYIYIYKISSNTL